MKKEYVVKKKYEFDDIIKTGCLPDLLRWYMQYSKPRKS